jgi:hypothetical protein
MTDKELKAARMNEALRHVQTTLYIQRPGTTRDGDLCERFLCVYESLADWKPVDPWEERADKLWAKTFTFFNASDRRGKGSNEDSAAILAIKAALIESYEEGKSAIIPDDVREAWAVVSMSIINRVHSKNVIILDAFFGEGKSHD